MVRLNRREHVVVGIAPEGFRGHINRRGARQADLWVPLGHHPAIVDDPVVAADRSADWLRISGRLEPGVTREAAHGAVAAVSRQLAEEHPATHEFRRGSVQPYTSTGANQIFEMAAIAVMFYAMSGAVLLVVCLNLAGMMLVRTASRRQELAVREALGASRWRLARYLMSESAVIALAGGVLGVAALRVATLGLVWWFGGALPPEWELSPARVGVFLLVSLATALIFGLAPSLRFSRGGMLTAMNDDTGGGGWRVGRAHQDCRGATGRCGPAVSGARRPALPERSGRRLMRTSASNPKDCTPRRCAWWVPATPSPRRRHSWTPLGSGSMGWPG